MPKLYPILLDVPAASSRVFVNTSRCLECGSLLDDGQKFCDTACAFDHEQNNQEQRATGN